MHSFSLVSAAVAVGAGLVSATSTCTQDITISVPTPTINCDVVAATITVDKQLTGDLNISGPKQIKGDLIINNATQLLSITSDTINSIEGNFELNQLTLLSSLQLSSLRTLNTINFVNLPQLSELVFGSEGVTHASSITISDTFLSTLSGLSLATVDSFQIDNNPKLTSFNSDLVNVTKSLIINFNGNDFAVNMTKLEQAGEIELSSIKSFDAPNLSVVTASIKFQSNPELKSFYAMNLTQVADSVSFINNEKLTNISFPALTKINGDMTIVNNTNLVDMDGFPKLQSVYGGIRMGGTFQKVELPALKDVRGAVNVTSTTDIQDFCEQFDQFHSDGVIQGAEKCTSNNTKAATGNPDGGSSDSGSGSGSGKDGDSAAGMTNVNFAVLALAAVAGLAQLM